jgi:hypothetical protein
VDVPGSPGDVDEAADEDPGADEDGAADVDPGLLDDGVGHACGLEFGDE